MNYNVIFDSRRIRMLKAISNISVNIFLSFSRIIYLFLRSIKMEKKTKLLITVVKILIYPVSTTEFTFIFKLIIRYSPNGGHLNKNNSPSHSFKKEKLNTRSLIRFIIKKI